MKQGGETWNQFYCDEMKWFYLVNASAHYNSVNYSIIRSISWQIAQETNENVSFSKNLIKQKI